MSETETFDDVGVTDSAVSVVKIAGKSYAVGLYWNEVADKTEAPKEARAMAARPTIEADLFTLRSQGDQFGLGWRRNGHAKGMPSLAGHMADARTGSQGNWLGLFEVDGGYYVVAVRDDVILASTDKVYSDELAARNQFEDLLGTDWAEIFAPDSMGFDNAHAVTAAAMVASGKPPRLQDVDKVSGIVKWGGALVAVLVLVFGGLWYQNHSEEMRLEEEAARLAELAKTNLPMMNQAPQVVVPPMPWENRFAAAPILKACSDGFRLAELDYPGWRAGKLECDGKPTSGPVVIRLTLDRSAPLGKGGGTINWIRWALDRNPDMAKASAMPSGEGQVTVSWTVPEVERLRVALAQKTPDIGRARFYLQSWFEEAFTPIAFPGAEQNQFWRANKFKFETPYDPAKFADIIGRIPGTTIDKVSVEVLRTPVTYTVEGTMHEQLPLPEGAKMAQPGQPQASASAAPPPATPKN